jgi:hypothetical protein
MRRNLLRTFAVVAFLLTLAQLGIQGVPAAVAANASSSKSSFAATTYPKIVVSSPTMRTYSLGQKLRVGYSCTSRSGIARCTASLGRVGSNAAKVPTGQRVALAKTGPYILRVRATDRRGRSASTTVRFIAERTISWSGYTWNVRASGRGGPGGNYWSDSKANVRLSGSDLLLSIAKGSSGRWTSAEIENRRNLGYGTYRWVVASDLSAFDAYQVLGMFTYGGLGPSITEIDVEPSHWGNLSWPNGSVVVWQNAATRARESRLFNYSNHPPYVNQFTWAPGSVHFQVTDATGATLFDWTVTKGVPRPSTEMPVINFWRFHNVPPAGVTTVRISSFTYAPLGR